MEVSGHLHAPATLLPGKELRYPSDRRLGGTQRRSGRGDEGKIIRSFPLLVASQSSQVFIPTTVATFVSSTP
jgi:hypothetical protein